MTDVAYIFTKRRSEFGKHCDFEDVPATVLEQIPVTCVAVWGYSRRNAAHCRGRDAQSGLQGRIRAQKSECDRFGHDSAVFGARGAA